jgi:hypothetical protein
MIPPLLFCALVLLPESPRCVDIGLLPLFCASAEQDHQLLAVFAEVHPLAWAKVQPQLKGASTRASRSREVPRRK